ncbi:MAG: hypothetical protein ABTQ29_04060 [Siculibacillus sp.]
MRALASAAALCLLAAGLAGCAEGGGIRPLYGTAAGQGTVDALRHVDVVSTGRIGQVIRNELVFGFYGGSGEATSPVRWRLDVSTATADTAVGIDRYSNLASAYLDQVSASWILTEVATGRTLTSGTSFANAAYDSSQQRFAGLRAKRDAENRAALTVASDIRNKVAVWFAANPRP